MSRQIRIASLIWGASILLSRVIGLIREAVFGRVLGTSNEADAYFAAFPFADFLNYLLAGGALSIVFIPIFGGYLARNEEARGWEAFSVVFTFAGMMICLASALMWLLVPALMPLVAPGFAGEEAALVVEVARIIIPAQIFHVLGGLLGAVLQARDKHALPALAPLVYTAGIIIGGLITGSAQGFAWGVVAGSFLGPFLLPLMGALRSGMRYRPLVRLGHPDLKRYLWLSLPIMLGFSIVAVDDWIVTREASKLGDGAVAVLNYAKHLMKVPMGVFGLATGVAAYPTLTRLIAAGQHAEAYQTLSRAVKVMLVLAFGSQVVLTVAGPEISAVLYGGRISDEEHALIGTALGILCLGLWAWAAQTVVARGFYARGETWLPTVIGSVAAIGFYPLYRLLAEQYGVLGLPVATTFSITTYVLVLVALLRRRHPGVSDGYGAFFLRIVPATAAGLGAGLLLDRLLHLPWPLAQGVVVGAAGGLVFFAVALLLRLEEARAVLGMLMRRIRRRSPA